MSFYFQLSNAVSFWVAMGTFYLLIMTYKDLKNNMRIDDRFNFFMMGASIMLLTHFYISVWYILALIIVILGLNMYLKKFNVLGGADISSIMWLFYGYAIINLRVVVSFVIVFLMLAGLYYFVRKLMKMPEDKPLPFMPVLLASFIINNLVWSLY